MDIDAEIRDAILSKQPTRLAVLRQLKAAVGIVLNTKGRNGKELSNDELFTIIRKLVGQRTESIAIYEKAGRDELAQTERNERDVLLSYLPDQLTDEEIEAIVDQAISETGAVSKKDMGRAISAAKELAKGKADPRILSQLIAKKLG